MFCKKCGNQLYDNAKFCNSCGYPIDNVSSDNKGGLLSIKKEHKKDSVDNKESDISNNNDIKQSDNLYNNDSNIDIIEVNQNNEKVSSDNKGGLLSIKKEHKKDSVDNKESDISNNNDIKQSDNLSNNDSNLNIIEISIDNQSNGEVDYSKIKKNRNFIIYLILAIITIGLYPIYFWHKFIKDMNLICGKEGESPNIILVLIFSIITCGIYYLYWIYKHSERIKNTAAHYNVVIKQSSGSILLWTIVGTIFAFIFSVLSEIIFISWFGILLGQYFMITNFNKLTNEITKGV